ncbi:MAG: 5' nucleotidase, NT5C type [Candidatus Limnocylindria bacterium]
MRIGIDIDDVTAVCALPYLRKFAEQFGVPLPREDEVGWHLLDEMDERVSAQDRDRFRSDLYEGPFFGELEAYADCPATLDRMVEAGWELHFITARAERRRAVTETWLREKGMMRHAKAVHLRPRGDFRPTVRGKYDAHGSAIFKVRLARELSLDAFCEDDTVIARALAEAGVRVWLFDRPWNRSLRHARVERVRGWSDLAARLGLA